MLTIFIGILLTIVVVCCAYWAMSVAYSEGFNCACEIFERRAVDVGVGEYFLDPIDGHTRKFRWKKPDPHPSL